MTKSLLSEFQQWKDEFERNSGTSFVKATGDKQKHSTMKLYTTKTVYYYCNRSGFFNSKGAGRCHIKSQGTSMHTALQPLLLQPRYLELSYV